VTGNTLFDREVLTIAAEDGRMGEWLQGAGVENVHVALVDSSGTLREKRLGCGAAVRAFERGWSFIDAIGWWGPDDRVWRSGGSEHQRARLDTGSGRQNPFEQNSVLFLADFEGPMAELSPRNQVTRMVDRLTASGLACEVGWEFECIVLESTPDLESGELTSLTPAMPTNRCWSPLTMATDAPIIGGWVDALSDGGVPVDHVCAELGPGCLELATEHRPALRAADDASWGKLFTKAYFARHALVATFMAQVSDGFPGLGGHPSVSFRSTEDGSTVLTEPDGSLTKTALAAIAGVTALLPELLVLAAPNPNSYRRFGPGNWAPSTATWGVGNYSCALRVVADDPESARLELRIPGADTSPHLCTAMLLGAVAWGIEQALEAPPPVQAPQDGREQACGRPLPRDLVEAAQRFSESSVAPALFGRQFVEHYAAGRIAEAHACSRFVSAQERQRYLRDV
jgi:glutamine synthetase